MNQPVKYPLHFPHMVGSYVEIPKPEDLQEYIDDFVRTWGKTEFEFNGNKVIAHNEKFTTFKRVQSDYICNYYEENKHRNTGD